MEGRRKEGRDYVMEKRESVHLETDVQGGWGMKLRVTSGHQDESSFSLVSSPQTCGLKAKQGVCFRRRGTGTWEENRQSQTS